MSVDAENASLKQIPIPRIDRNPENPRLIFRPNELENLLESISQYGVQVPISVYKQGGRYILIDGERRWKCCSKLNLKTIPALIQEKPTPLQNLLLMFNIHALREQWDLFTIALKLPSIIELYKKKTENEPTEAILSQKTGLLRSVIRRSKLLMELPQKYKDVLLLELKKPKHLQKLSEDFFIEMERALKTTQRAMPELIEDKDVTREVLIEKYKKDIISNLVHFRNISKIARAEKISEDQSIDARKVLTKLFKKNKYSIEQAYEDSVSGIYTEKNLISRINSLLEKLESFEAEEIDEILRQELQRLFDKLDSLLNSE